MGLFQNGIQIVENYKHTKTNNINIKSLSGYDAIREQLDEHSTLTVKHQPIETAKPKNKMPIGLY